MNETTTTTTAAGLSGENTARTVQKNTTHQCPGCGCEGRLYITKEWRPRVIIGCADCDMAENEDGKWVFYVGGITVHA